MTCFNTPFSASSKSDSAFDDLTASLGDARPHPTEQALIQLGRALMTELVDVISDTALEDYQTILGEALIGAFHSAAGRIERDADRARDAMRALDRDFDGSEAADVELQDATAKARAGDAATQACELIRDAASETWTIATGEVWTAWRGSRRGTHLTAAQLEAKQAIRAIRNRRSGEADPGGPVIAFRGAPTADTAEDAGRIFDALNWAKAEWPDMALATTGAKGSEKLAIKWAQQKGVKLILARADFDRNGKAAPFRANDELIALEPEVCLTLVHSLAGVREDQRPFGPALNLGQKAMENGLRHVPIKARAAWDITTGINDPLGFGRAGFSLSTGGFPSVLPDVDRSCFVLVKVGGNRQIGGLGQDKRGVLAFCFSQPRQTLVTIAERVVDLR